MDSGSAFQKPHFGRHRSSHAVLRTTCGCASPWRMWQLCVTFLACVGCWNRQLPQIDRRYQAGSYGTELTWLLVGHQGSRASSVQGQRTVGTVAATSAAEEAGAASATAAAGMPEEVPRSRWASAWGAFGCSLYLSYGIRKVVPIVMDGLQVMDTGFHWSLLLMTLFFFAYFEGYKGFQKGFSPRVVSRAWVVAQRPSNSTAPPFWHKVLAPWFCIGYFHGTQKRVITSWCVTAGIFLIVIGVKKLSQPWRAILDAGVMLGLSWGAISIILIYLRSLACGKPPVFNPALPEDTPYRPLQQAA
mmetsp:Transcript_38774/g.76838  ORF Transcript_38774/g.76838 Transcript_38774/m.76838 type:complete len:302 (-) Transcript_38774:152-1057(-)